MKHPTEDQIQIVVFGPGFGESILMHLGNRNWFIIDSCINDEESPAALSFLKDIGVNVAKEVKLVVATHWHSDHTMGLFQTLKECKSAKFAVSATLRDEVFRDFLKIHNNNAYSRIPVRGDQEVLSCFNEIIKFRGESPVFVQQNLEIWSASKGELKHNKPVQIFSTFTIKFQMDAFLLKIGNQMDFIKSKSKTKPVKQRTVSLDNENDISIATLVTIGDFSILLGADVEMSDNPTFGWKNIVNNYKQRKPKPHILKVPSSRSEVWSFPRNVGLPIEEETNFNYDTLESSWKKLTYSAGY